MYKLTFKPVAPCEARILVVEDSTANLITIVRLLAACGVPPTNAHWKSCGWGVVQYADLLPPLDVILLDIGLPGEDGFEIFGKIRSIPQFDRTLVIAVTGHTDQMDKAKTVGFNGFLGKPLDMNRFPGQLGRILQGGSVWEQ